MKINDSVAFTVSDIYYDTQFRNVLEDHMTFLREHPKTSIASVKVRDAYKYEGDLSGLLSAMNIEKSMHWVIMRMNNMTSPSDVKSSLKSLYIPKTEIIDRIREVFLTQSKISF
jgi:hypothetical protein